MDHYNNCIKSTLLLFAQQEEKYNLQQVEEWITRVDYLLDNMEKLLLEQYRLFCGGEKREH